MRVAIRELIVCFGIASAGVAGAAPGDAAPKVPSNAAPSAPKDAAPAPPPAPEGDEAEDELPEDPAEAAPEEAAPATPAGPAPAGAKGRKVNPQMQYKLAEQARKSGDRKQSLALIDAGLAAAPKHVALLHLKGTLLLELNDLRGALATYKILAAGAPSAPQRDAKKIVAILEEKLRTFVEVTVANGPATVHFGLRPHKRSCTAEPSCKEALSPGNYKVTVERPGFERWTERVAVQGGATKQLAVTLTEKPSPLTVRTTPPDAVVTVDGVPHTSPAPIPPGEREITVSLQGHATVRLKEVAREGKPIERDIALVPIIPVHVEPAGARLLLGGAPVDLQDGGIAVRPGAHVLVASAPGFQDARREIPAKRPAGYKIELRLQPRLTEPDRDGPWTPRRKIALAATGVGLAALGTGAVLGRQSGQLESDAYALCPSPSTPCSRAADATDLNQRGQSRAFQANVAFGVAGGAAIAATILWLTGAPESRVAVTPRLGGAAGLDLAVRF